MIFTMFWTIEFVHALGTIGFAAATTSWYFHPTDKDSAAVDVSVSFNDGPVKHPPKKLEGIKQIAADVREAMFKHAGTAAFGSCIIAVVETIETIVSYIQAKVEQTIKASGNTAVLLMARMILCCIRCFLWCIEKCLKFISKHAYIQTAIYGTSFMPSCYKAFFLIIRNAGLATCLTGIGSFVFVIGRSVVTLSAASVAFLWIDSAYGDDINSPLFPTVVVCIMAYVIASVFMGILEISSDTLLACYVLDKEMHDDSPEYARGALQTWVKNSVITNADGKQYASINTSEE
uniref:Choline transporter-like protein n=1 Tax=Octactis speculum TaxID=3111310 RepID=A0A7S2DLI7_9STRA|mmetsp:Transcript_5069/g.6158  ORF Transcript_5069/g.6158 Transcript_5069/m.6158 type:complete len:290 (+) Transcript_5069:169-1038(+)